MSFTELLPEINKHPKSVFVMHERSEKTFAMHAHTKGQLTYTEGGIAYVEIENKTYVVPAQHFLWIPKGIQHKLRLANSVTVIRNLFFYAHDDEENPFFSKLDIYPASKLFIEIIRYTEKWDGQHVGHNDENFELLVALKKLLPELGHKTLPIALPTTDDARMAKIVRHLENNFGKSLTLETISIQFNMSERSISRLFQSTLQISFLQYLKTLRIVKAIEMLVKTNDPISEIAFNVGYDTIGSFSNAFYALMQSRPSDFRKK